MTFNVIFHCKSLLSKKHRAERSEQKGLYNVVCLLACYQASHGAVQTTARTGVRHRGHSWHSCCPKGQQEQVRGATWDHNQRHKISFVFLLFFSYWRFCVEDIQGASEDEIAIKVQTRKSVTLTPNFKTEAQLLFCKPKNVFRYLLNLNVNCVSFSKVHNLNATKITHLKKNLPHPHPQQFNAEHYQTVKKSCISHPLSNPSHI